ncbi:MAG TPA: carboxymuconolactone decarboxylase family protein [Oscillospiraceae bacterium]|nr:carboxymuconolactone decarboxylase family protein [Oscillospiraceae bacterium]
MRTYKYTARAKKDGSLNAKLIERVMLAVTEVNQCPLCSYGHTRMALATGMSHEEIQNLLSHSLDSVPDGELEAILFAQHYADSRAQPSTEAWRRVADLYGEAKARGILGAVRMITFGNTYGIVLSSIKGRLSGKPDPRSGVLYEIAMLLAIVPFPPIALVHALISDLLGRPVI